MEAVIAETKTLNREYAAFIEEHKRAVLGDVEIKEEEKTESGDKVTANPFTLFNKEYVLEGSATFIPKMVTLPLEVNPAVMAVG